MIALVSSAVALAAPGCRAPVTEVLVIVDTDLEVPDEIDRLRATVDGPGEPQFEPIVDRVHPLPRTIALQYTGTREGAAVTIRIDGLREGLPVIDRRARFAFVRGEIRQLRLDLLRSCLDADCGEDETCGRDGCRPIDVAPEELEPYAGPPGRLDGGAPNPPDAAEPPDDAGDAGSSPPDDAGAVCDIPATCGTGSAACVCNACPCVVACADDCAVECRSTAQCNIDGTERSTLDLSCIDSTCTIAARHTSSVQLRCDQNASCDIDCRNTGSCEVSCTGGSACRFRCTGGSECSFARCDGEMRSCPGNFTVCNRGC